MNFDIKAYQDDISSINTILINSIVTHFTPLSDTYKGKLELLKAATSIENDGTAGRRSRRVQARLQKELADIKAILGDAASGAPGQDCDPSIAYKINRTPSEKITELFNSINSVDNINYIYFSIPTIYSKTLHLISSLKVASARQVKYELMNIFTKLFFNLNFNVSHVKKCWEFGDKEKIEDLSVPEDQARTRGELKVWTESQLGIHLDKIITDLDSVLYLINCVLDSNYDTESETVVSMAKQINEMQERFNEKIELSSVPEEPDESEEVGMLTQVPGEITEQTNLVTEDEPQEPIVGLNVLPRGQRQEALA